MISVFSYTNYRDFLRDKFQEEKSKKRGYSYRSFNRKAGISSSSFLKLVIDAKRNLSPDGIKKIARAFQLSDSETAYLIDLVHFNQSKGFDEKDFFFKKIVNHLYEKEIKLIHPDHYYIFSSWYYLPILELVRLPIKRGEKRDEHWIQKYLHSEITLTQVKEALKRLAASEFLKKTSQGYVRNDILLTTPNEVQSHYLVNLYRNYSDRAKTAVSEDHEDLRDFSSLTIAVSKKGFELAKNEIIQFRKRLHILLEDKSLGEKEMVAQMNLQLFQICRRQSEKEK